MNYDLNEAQMMLKESALKLLTKERDGMFVPSGWKGQKDKELRLSGELVAAKVRKRFLDH